MECPLWRLLISSRSVSKHGHHMQFLFLIGRFLGRYLCCFYRTFTFFIGKPTVFNNSGHSVKRCELRDDFKYKEFWISSFYLLRKYKQIYWITRWASSWSISLQCLPEFFSPTWSKAKFRKHFNLFKQILS
jgi:hypothetical protein